MYEHILMDPELCVYADVVGAKMNRIVINAVTVIEVKRLILQ
jgi:hypothetical protein